MGTSVRTLRRSEKDEQRAVYQLLVRCECAVYWLSQARETQQTPGVPDLIAFHALRGFAFIECKVPNGRMSSAQREFQHHCGDAGITYIVGGTAEVRDWLGAKHV
jgi:hypothetical protein